MLFREATTLNYLPPGRTLFSFLRDLPHAMLMSSAMRPKSWPKTSMKALTKFSLASFWTLGSKQSPEKLCQLIPFRNNTGPSTSERDGRERTKGTEIRDKKATGGLWMNKWMSKRINEGKRREKAAKVDKWEDQLLVMVDKYKYIYIYIYIYTYIHIYIYIYI